MTLLRDAVLARITPTADDEARMQAVVERLLSRANKSLQQAGVQGDATVQGSVAKGTWLRGGGDIDMFLLVDPALPLERLEQVAVEIGPKVLDKCQKRYAQHPYLTGEFEGHAVDLVPAYRVTAATARMSAVDRTPFHTQWVRKHLDARRAADVRLLKQWMKGVGAYGAQTAVGGFSGYLAEVLIVHFGSFDAVVAWLAASAKPRRISIGPDQVTDEVSLLVVVDPVDPSRNCAAAVQAPTLALATQGALAFRAGEAERFFFPSPPRAEPTDLLQDAMRRKGTDWVGIAMRPRTDRLDIVFPQFQKAARSIETALVGAGFEVLRMQALATADERHVLLQWMVPSQELEPSRLHRGPPDDGRPNADKFREKWNGHADALGPVRVGRDNRLEVEVAIRLRTPAKWLRESIGRVALGRHVQDALADHEFWDDPATVSPEWQAAVADFMLDRRSWER